MRSFHIYAFRYPLGRLTATWLRTRLVAVGVAFWSLLTAASGMAGSNTAFMAARLGVGIGEASSGTIEQRVTA